MWEEHANDVDISGTGSGITLRAVTNPTEGCILSVRSNLNASRFWTGQDLTSPGLNPFFGGFTGVAGEEWDSSKYQIRLGLNGQTSYFNGPCLGVGTTTPSTTFKLDVDGSTRFNNTLHLRSDLRVNVNGTYEDFIVPRYQGMSTLYTQGISGSLFLTNGGFAIMELDNFRHGRFYSNLTVSGTFYEFKRCFVKG